MEQPVLMTTGVPQLDLILGGGVIRGSLVLVAGAPGTGKTVLGAQVAWAAAGRAEQVLFVTAYSEPHNKLIRHLQTFSFFDQDQLGERIKLLNVQHQLSHSIEEVSDTLVREARQHKAKLLILDGFQGIEASHHDPHAAHQFLFEISAKLGLLDITLIMTYDLSSEQVDRAELTAVDGIVSLSQDLYGDHAVRVLQVIKNRGAAPLLGRHSFQITDDGITCYPRQEALTPNDYQPTSHDRLAFGIAPLDSMINGGLNQGTTSIIAGGEGVGKTLLSLHYLMTGVAHGDRTILLTFHETPQQLMLRGELMGLDIQAAITNGLLHIMHYPPVELNPDLVAYELRQAIETHAAQRLVIDGLNEIERPLIERGRAPSFFAGLNAYLRNQQITACITLEIDPVIGRELSFVGKNMSALADNLLLLRHSEEDHQSSHQLVVLKMRFSSHERLPRTYSITNQGITFGYETTPPRTKRRTNGS